VNGDTTATALTAGPTLATAAVTGSAVGSYQITVAGGTSTNYTLTRPYGTLTVTRAALALKADPKSKIYGADNPTLTVSAVGIVNGDTTATALTAGPTLATTAVTGSPVGSYPITLTGGTSANYLLTRQNGTLTVTKAALALKADPKSKIYGGSNPTLTFSAIGLVNGDTTATALTATPTLATAAVTGSPVGSYQITVTGGTSTNYTLTRPYGSLSVTKAPLTLKADPKSKIQGADNPTLTFSAIGLVNGDTTATALTATPTLSTTAVTGSPVGSYPITLTGGTSANYLLTRQNSTLTVTSG
ncbi:MAG: hypothetical protein JWO11_4185, partial [Nocardioides sp.]|nr:hypothetical protein [Nocardioides sp.]